MKTIPVHPHRSVLATDPPRCNDTVLGPRLPTESERRTSHHNAIWRKSISVKKKVNKQTDDFKGETFLVLFFRIMISYKFLLFAQCVIKSNSARGSQLSQTL